MFVLKIFFFLPLVVFSYQLYNFAVTRKFPEKEVACYGFGIAYTVLGILCFVFREPLFSFLGLLLLMLGLLLISNGLQRRDKRIFIDRYAEDQDDKDSDSP